MEKIASEALAQLMEELKRYDRETIEKRATIPSENLSRHSVEDMGNV